MAKIKKKSKSKVEKKSTPVVQSTPSRFMTPALGDREAIIGISIGATINMGNYESARVDLTMTMKSDDDKTSVEEGFVYMTDLLHEELERQVSIFTEE